MQRLIVIAILLTTVVAAPALPIHRHFGAAMATLVGTQYLTCDGVDDTAALNAALAQGGLVSIGPGTCALTSAIHILTSNTTLSGAGTAQTVLRNVTSAAFNLIEIGLASRVGQTSNVAVYQIGLVNNGHTSRTIPKRGNGIIAWTSSNHVEIHDVDVSGAGQAGIFVIGSYVQVFNSFVHDNQQNGIYVSGTGQPGVWARPASYITIYNNTVQHNSLRRAPGSKPVTGLSAWDGIDADPCHFAVRILNNKVVENDILLLENGEVCTWSGNDEVRGNLVQNSVQSGIDVANRIKNFAIDGNTLVNDWNQSIVVGGVASNGVISGNTIKGGGPIVVRTTTYNVAQK